ncbi:MULTISPECIES: hypothetical protein [Rhizobium]|uniref:hypothetical protein n=1 Tax=Rhizobium TaxID=379 RepID=UPI001C83806E|nr:MULTISPECIES: hypothetical protein [Rhizobium]MBX4952074.1 hypothetical protein [Rhizobium binae]MBX5226853.1 hypothetical protein [Rhizobium sp. NLR9b]MBX5238175.1 hypothetical protein [Rhizobium sp. NLR22b]MBX5276096.1 hypothetical protein [Rhizobium sp. NLR13a]MBX5287524.1 hypothetical protein [Rhizobium sp. NLR10b]
MKPNANLKPSDLVYELADLERLLDTIRNLLVEEVDYRLPDGGRNNPLDRVTSLINIAHFHVAHVAVGIEHFDIPGAYVSRREMEGSSNA